MKGARPGSLARAALALAMIATGAASAVACGASADSLAAAPKGSTTGDNPRQPGSLVHETIVVHASNNLFPFRVCTQQGADRPPVPTTKLMPQSNVVGVEVGSAVHLGDLAIGSGDALAAGPGVSDAPWGVDAGATDGGALDGGALDGAAPADGGIAADAGAGADAGGAVEAGAASPTTLYLVDARNLAGDATCRTLLATRRPFVRVPLTAADVTTLSTGVNLLVISGCLAGGGTKGGCGADYDPARSNLSYRVFPLTGAVEGGGLHAQFLSLAPGVDVSLVAFDDVLPPARGKAPTVLARAPSYAKIQPGAPLALPFDAGSLAAYAEKGFVVKHSRGELAQSLAEIQTLSSPLTLPGEFFVFPSNYVLMFMGDPDVARDGDPGKRLHLVAIPVTNPDTFRDAGAEGGDAAVSVPRDAATGG